MSIAPFVTYCIALFIAAIVPGPGIAALVGQSLGGNIRSAMAFLAGLALGDVVYLTIAVVGLAALAQSFALGFVIIKALGGLYLLYLSWCLLTAKVDPQGLQEKRERSPWHAAVAGFAVTLGNPKTIIFYLALLPGLMDLNSVGLVDWSILAVLTVAVLFLSLTPYAMVANKARKVLSTHKVLMRINQIAGSVIGVAGVWILGQAALATSRRL